MLKRVRIFLVNIFGFSRSEANGVLVLILIIILSRFIPWSFWLGNPESSTGENAADLLEWTREIEASIVRDQPEEIKTTPFNFDPNSASLQELIKLGFNESLAKRVINYRDAGGRFKEAEDLSKIYGIPDHLVNSLSPYVRIAKVAVNRVIDEKVPVEESKPPQREILKKIDLNLADTVDLKSIFGIGSKLSNRIINFRENLGGFYSMDQLSEVYNLPDTVIVKMLKRFELNHLPESLNINSMGEAKLRDHPYIDYNLARSIVRYRNKHGAFQTKNSLLEIKSLTDSVYQKLEPYLSISQE